MGSEQHYSLRWNDYTVKICTAFQSLRDEEDFVDVTVACDGHSYSAHKMVLSACSPYFRALLRANPCQHPIVILKDVGHVELERLLEFMYNGEVSIAQDQLAAFLKTAENLKIRGLAGSSDDMEQMGQLQRPDVSYSYSSCSIGGGTSGRSSPSAGYAHSQGSKDEEAGGDGSGGYHTRAGSPPSKRRKRPNAPAASHAESNTATHPTEGVVGEAPVEGDADIGGVMVDDELRKDRRELKSEPGDLVSDMYSETSEITDPASHTALPGPSGSATGNSDSIGPHEPGGGDDDGDWVVKEEIGEEQWWGELGGVEDEGGVGDDAMDGGERHSQSKQLSPSRAPSLSLSSSPCAMLPITAGSALESKIVSTLLEADGKEGTRGISVRKLKEDHRGRTLKRSPLTRFDASFLAPLSRLESLAHFSFAARTAAGAANILDGRGSEDLLDEGVAQRFSSSTSSSQSDLLTSSDQTPWYTCSQCGKGFRTRVTLSRHEKIHSGKAFPCPICPKIFYQVSNVKYHVHAVHGLKYEPPGRTSQPLTL